MAQMLENEKYCLRACIVNFRTSKKDVKEVVEIIVQKRRKMHERMSDV